jgi:hypothetical protein
MHKYMDELQIKLNAIGEAIYRTYSPPVAEPKPEVEPESEPAPAPTQTQSQGTTSAVI